MRIGIVGSEARKFTDVTELKARGAIIKLLQTHRPSLVVSGACHLGGIDVWAIEEARKLGIPTLEFPPEDHTWSGGYKPRNLQIVENSDMVVCITLKELPPEYSGMRFERCYHCNTDTHVKSGGCWTMHQARKQGKAHQLIVI